MSHVGIRSRMAHFYVVFQRLTPLKITYPMDRKRSSRSSREFTERLVTALPKFQNPGAFFLGTLVAQEQKFLKPLIENALKNGYTRFVEPCAGAFAMSHIAAQSGYKPEQIESSDVAMFTSIMGYAITGQSLEELEIRAHGFSNEELLDPAVALYAQLYLRTVKSAGKEYFYNIMRDLECRKDEHVRYIREQLDRAKDFLHGMSYRPLDMWKHLEECYDDPHAIVIANPPTYTAGFEKWYDTGGRMSWKEPEYGIFDPSTGLKELYEKMQDAKCLLVCYEENAPGLTARYSDLCQIRSPGWHQCVPDHEQT